MGRVCVVTGSTSGIGLVTTRELARDGDRVIMMARNADKGEQVRDDIRRETGNVAVDLIVADFGSFASIRRGAAEVLDCTDRIDVLVNNAGAINTERTTTPDGIETTFAVNHLGYFLLTRLLRDTLVRSAPARIVNVASRAHKRTGMRFDDLLGERSFNGVRAYCQSKLANVMFTYALARRLSGTGVTANCLHPGVIASGFGKNSSGVAGMLIGLARPFMWTPEKGARASLRLARAPELRGVTGRYFDQHGKETPSSSASMNEADQERLWEISETMISAAS